MKHINVMTVLLIWAVVAGMFLACEAGYGGPSPTPATTASTAATTLIYGLGIGLGVGLPFINVCINSPRALKALFLRQFGIENVKILQIPDYGVQPEIECAEDLTCDFEKDCLKEWQNDPDDRFCEQHYFIAEGRPQHKGNWSKLMGGGTTFPKGPFAFSASRKSKENYPIYLTSKVIPKQPGKGMLRLKYWITEPAILQVCLKLESSDFTVMPGTCSNKVTHSNETNLAEFKIKGPIKEPFQLVIISSNFVQSGVGMVALDDIEYSSSLCRQ